MVTTKGEQKDDFIFPVDKLYSQFEEHVNQQKNERIVFSGKFGIGKTYFLENFFKDNDNTYEVFHLFPVSYQIASNEDVVEYLKHDLLVEILNKAPNTFSRDDVINLSEYKDIVYEWGKENVNNIIKNSLSYIPKLGRPLSETIDLIDDFNNFKEEYKNLEEKEISKQLDHIATKRGNETDLMSQLIKRKINKIKEERKSVLILDDLDRIDPEHIFRILNIFSAHLKQANGLQGNKFGFDKIILVADVRNVRSTFHHKYGPEADFSGYFDKFYSSEIFMFRNEDIIEEYLDELISAFNVGNNAGLDGGLGKSGYLRILLKEILLRGFKVDGKEKLNLRQLLVPARINLPSLKKMEYRNGFGITDMHESMMSYINIALKTVISILGGRKDNLRDLLLKIKSELSTDVDGNEDRIYRVFSQHILFRLSPYETNKQNISHGWGKYSIRINNGEVTKVIDKQTKERIHGAILFYDLLIEYLANDYYSQNKTV